MPAARQHGRLLGVILSYRNLVRQSRFGAPRGLPGGKLFPCREHLGLHRLGFVGQRLIVGAQQRRQPRDVHRDAARFVIPSRTTYPPGIFSARQGGGKRRGVIRRLSQPAASARRGFPRRTVPDAADEGGAMWGTKPRNRAGAPGVSPASSALCREAVDAGAVARCRAAVPGPMPMARSAARPFDADAMASGAGASRRAQRGAPPRSASCSESEQLDLPAHRSTASRSMPPTCPVAAPAPMPGARSAARPSMPARWRAAPASRPASGRETLDAGMVASGTGIKPGEALHREALDAPLRHDVRGWGERRWHSVRIERDRVAPRERRNRRPAPARAL
jgi:hypothetical protein